MITASPPSVMLESIIVDKGLGSLAGTTDGGSYLDMLASLGVPMASTKRSTTSSTMQKHGGSAPVARSTDMMRVCKDGARTEHLTRLAGIWIREGKTIDEVVLLACGWNSRNTPPLDDQKIVSTCESILQTHQRNHPGTAVANGPITPLFDISEARVDDMLVHAPPDRRWLLKNCLPYGKVGMIIAPGGTGKSMFALQFAVSLATGTQFAGHWEIGEVGATLLLFGEEDREEIHRRLHHIVGSLDQRDGSAASAIKRRVFAKSMVGVDNLMTHSLSGANSVVATSYADRLIMTARQIPELKLIVIDPASRFRGGVENSAEDTTRFVEQLERVCQETGATVLVLHHANKHSSHDKEANQGASRGSSAMTDGVRWQMNLSKPTAKDAKDFGIDLSMKHKYLIASVTKNNYGPPQEDVVLFRGEHGVLTASAAHTAIEPPAQTLVRLLTSEKAGGTEYSAAAFENKYGGETGPFKMGKHALRDVLGKAFVSGLIRKRDGKRGKIEIVAP